MVTFFMWAYCARMSSERPSCGLGSLLSVSCRGRAEAFARRLHSRLQSLGRSQPDPEPPPWTSTTTSSSESDIYFDLDSPTKVDGPDSDSSDGTFFDPAVDSSDSAPLDFRYQLSSSTSTEPELESQTSSSLSLVSNTYDVSSNSWSSSYPNGKASPELDCPLEDESSVCNPIAETVRSNFEALHLDVKNPVETDGINGSNDADHALDSDEETEHKADDAVNHESEFLSEGRGEEENCEETCDRLRCEERPTELLGSSYVRPDDLAIRRSTTERNGVVTDYDHIKRNGLPSVKQNGSFGREDDDDDDEENGYRQRVRRCSSLKTGKTPPGTPGRKKIVRFADVLGLDLADVRTFLDEIPRIPSSAYDDLRDADLSLEPAGNPAITGIPTVPAVPIATRCLVPMFQQPGGFPNFLDRLREKKVCLENAVVLDPTLLSITGTVRVQNLDFHKSVHIRYTINGWHSFADLQATYVSNSCDGFSDKFSFILYAHTLQVGERLEFAVRFQCRGCQYWDNNDGANYAFQCLPPVTNPAPIVPSPEEQWTSFY